MKKGTFKANTDAGYWILDTGCWMRKLNIKKTKIPWFS